MPTILAESFTASLGRLSDNEQKQAKLTAFDLQTDRVEPGHDDRECGPGGGAALGVASPLSSSPDLIR
ncbi:hypothetical protein ACUN0C_00960 [Faunimonas sp. B44]|uniref:hypothetical protein n=1 Tax=Faunimonas sp. B44 TaxID=3461493 RepID=UPI0040446CB0